jgi:hypothetical protein
MQVDLIIVQSSAGTLARTCRHNYFLESLEIRGIFVASCGKGFAISLLGWMTAPPSGLVTKVKAPH